MLLYPFGALRFNDGGTSKKRYLQQSDNVITRPGRCALPSVAFNATLCNVITMTLAVISIISTILLVGVG